MQLVRMYVKAMENGGTVDSIGIAKQEEHRRKLAVEWYNAMATDKELEFLNEKTNDFGERLKMAEGLTDIVLKRMAKMYEGYGVEKPPKYMQPPDPRQRGVKRKAPPIAFFEKQRSAFKSHCESKGSTHTTGINLFTKPDRASFQTWRKAYELDGEGPVVAPPATDVAPPAARGGGVGGWF